MRLGSTCHVVGLDPWKAGQERQIKKEITCSKNIELVEGVAEAMPFDAACFDLIISNNGLNNVQNLQKSLLECGRVAKKGAQLVFTYNTDKTFHEFYTILRRTLQAYKLKTCLKKLDEHIYSKRKPLAEYRTALIKAGFRVMRVYHDSFAYRFNDGTSILNHFSMNMSFLSAWKYIVPENRRIEVFSNVEERINKSVEQTKSFSMSVPFVTVNCRKK